MPVTASPHGVWAAAQMPRTIASAQGALTAPCAFKTSSDTPSSSCLARFEYTTTPRSNHADEPATLVRRWPTSPPVQDSAVATVKPRARSLRPTTCSSVSPSRP